VEAQAAGEYGGGRPARKMKESKAKEPRSKAKKLRHPQKAWRRKGKSVRTHSLK